MGKDNNSQSRLKGRKEEPPPELTSPIAGSASGMAFVLVQHLPPDDKGILAELTQCFTSMQVFKVEDEVAIIPDCAYIIPPNRDLAFLSGTPHLLQSPIPHGHRLPITISSFALWSKISTRGRSLSRFPAPAVTAPWGCGTSRPRVAWS